VTIKIKKEWFTVLPIVLLILAIGFSPIFSIGPVPGGKILEFRIGDILLVVLGLVWFGSFIIGKRKSIEWPPLLLPIAAWLGIGLLSTVTNAIFGSIDLQRSLFHVLKEAQFFFIYFYIFYHIRTRGTIQWVLKLWIAIAVVHIAWIIFQIAFGLKLTYYYSYTIFISPSDPFISGGFLLLIFAFFLNVYLYQYSTVIISPLRKGVLFLFITLPVLGLWTSGSRVVLIGLIAVLFFTFLLYSLKKNFFMHFLQRAFVLSLLTVGFLTWQFSIDGSPFQIVSSDSHRIFNLERMIHDTRLTNWKLQTIELTKQPFSLILGHGKAVKIGGVGSGNYYLESLVGTGFVGISLFFILIASIIRIAWQGFSNKGDSLIIGLCGGLLAATLAILILAVPAGAFRIAAIPEVYWFLLALTFAALRIIRYKQEHETATH